MAPWEREPDPCWSCGGAAEARDDIHVRCIDTKGVNCEVMDHWYTRKTWNTRASQWQSIETAESAIVDAARRIASLGSNNFFEDGAAGKEAVVVKIIRSLLIPDPPALNAPERETDTTTTG